jgi:hypothetical protein
MRSATLCNTAHAGLTMAALTLGGVSLAAAIASWELEQETGRSRQATAGLSSSPNRSFPSYFYTPFDDCMWRIGRNGKDERGRPPARVRICGP